MNRTEFGRVGRHGEAPHNGHDIEPGRTCQPPAQFHGVDATTFRGAKEIVLNVMGGVLCGLECKRHESGMSRGAEPVGLSQGEAGLGAKTSEAVGKSARAFEKHYRV